MTTIRYEFVASGHEAVNGAFRSIAATARETRREVAAVGAAQERAARAPVAAPAARAGRAARDEAAAQASKSAERVLSIEQAAAEKRFLIQQRAEERRVGLVRTSTSRILAEIGREERAVARAAEREAEARRRVDRAPLTALGRGIVGVGGAAVTGGLALATGLSYAASRDALALRRATTRLSINARGAGEQFVDPATLDREFTNAAVANPGIKATDIAEGVAKFVGETGDLESARKFAGTFATFASGEGANVADVASASAQIFKKFGIKSERELQESLAAMGFQGKAAAFEIRDMASQLPRIASAAARFDIGKGAGSVRLLGGLTQMAKESFGSPEETATGVSAMFREILEHAGDLEKGKAGQHGKVQIFKRDAKGRRLNETLPITDILPNLIAAHGGRPDALQKSIREGNAAITPLITAYNEAGKGIDDPKKREAAGIEAVRATMAKFIDAPGDWAEVVKDAAAAQKDAGAQLTAVWAQVTAQIGAAVLPALATLGAELSKQDLAPALQSLGDAALLAGSSLMLFVDALKALGILGEKKGSPQEELKRAQGELAKFDQAHAGGPLLPMEAAQRAKLAASADAAAAKVQAENALLAKPMTGAEFAKQYDALGDEGFAHAAFRQSLGATPLAVRELLGGTVAGQAFGRLVGGESEAQAAFRERAQIADGEKSPAGQVVDAGAANTFMGAVAALREAATRLGTAATLTGHQPGAPAAPGG